MGNQEPDLNGPKSGHAQGLDVSCDNCGAAVFWRPGPQAMVCDHCGQERKIERLPGEILEYTLEKGRRQGDEALAIGGEGTTKALVCGTCGARVLLGGRAISKACAFCGSGHVLEEDSLRQAIQPESVIPMMMPRDEVAAIFRSWLRGLWFRPSALKRLKGFDARGIYVPAWTFDARADSSWTAQAGYYYYVTETYHVTVNGKSQLRTRQVRKVRWESAAGRRHDAYDDLQVMASKGVDRQLALELGPFETGELVPYQPEYLVGWEAEEYGVDLEDGWGLGQNRMLESQVERCSGDVPGDTQRGLRVQTQLSDVRWKHVLLPVWSLTYHFAGKPYAVLVNGQSGQIAGKAPYSWIKISLAVLLSAVIIGGIVVAANA